MGQWITNTNQSTTEKPAHDRIALKCLPAQRRAKNSQHMIPEIQYQFVFAMYCGCNRRNKSHSNSNRDVWRIYTAYGVGSEWLVSVGYIVNTDFFDTLVLNNKLDALDSTEKRYGSLFALIAFLFIRHSKLIVTKNNNSSFDLLLFLTENLIILRCTTTALYFRLGLGRFQVEFMLFAVCTSQWNENLGEISTLLQIVPTKCRHRFTLYRKFWLLLRRINRLWVENSGEFT